MAELFLDGRVTLHCGDCLDVLASLPANSIDAIVTDPPYGLEFMGKGWDKGVPGVPYWRQALRVLKPGGHLASFGGTRTYHRMACAIEDAGFEVRDQIGWAFGQGFPKSRNIGNGWGTALKPAWEPICLARKPLEGTVAANVLKWGTGALNIDGCRIGVDGGTRRSHQESYGPEGRADQGGGQAWRTGHKIVGEGRWPANVITDGSEQVLAAFPEQTSGGTPSSRAGDKFRGVYGEFKGGEVENGVGSSSGSAARFFYTAKADADDRLGSKHPTVKPLDLMQWLCRLVTPPKGVLLDPFAGTGTTGEAAWREGFAAILIQRGSSPDELEYQNDIRRRMALAQSGPAERSRESIKAKTKDKPVDAGPLFGGLDGAGGWAGGSTGALRTDGAETVGGM